VLGRLKGGRWAFVDLPKILFLLLSFEEFIFRFNIRLPFTDEAAVSSMEI